MCDLTLDQFHAHARKFVDKVHHLEQTHAELLSNQEWFQGWEWVPLPAHPFSRQSQGFLSRRVFLHSLTESGEQNSETSSDSDADLEDAFVDSTLSSADPATVDISGNEHSTVQLSVSFNSAYGAPVLFIQSDDESVLSALLRQQALAPTADIVSPEIHPVTRQACFMVNPCRTGDAMHLLLQSANEIDNFLVVWMTLLSSLFTLKSSPAVYKHFIQPPAKKADSTVLPVKKLDSVSMTAKESSTGIKQTTQTGVAADCTTPVIPTDNKSENVGH